MVEVFSYNELETTNTAADEQETTINISRDEDTASIYTSDNTMITKLKNLWKTYPNSLKCWECGRDSLNKVTGYMFVCSKKSISFRSGEQTRKKKEE